MGRPRQFDHDVALERAMDVFWTKGYAGASIDDLLTAMQIQRGSMYQAFGSKAELFVAALRLYRERWGEMIRGHVAAADGPAREVLISLLRRMGAAAVDDPLRRGCLLANSAAALRDLDPDAAEVVRGGLGGLERLFADLLTRAAADGDLAPGRDPRAHARFLIAALDGVRNAAKAGASRRRLGELMESLISIV